MMNDPVTAADGHRLQVTSNEDGEWPHILPQKQNPQIPKLYVYKS